MSNIGWANWQRVAIIKSIFLKQKGVLIDSDVVRETERSRGQKWSNKNSSWRSGFTWEPVNTCSQQSHTMSKAWCKSTKLIQCIRIHLTIFNPNPSLILLCCIHDLTEGAVRLASFTLWACFTARAGCHSFHHHRLPLMDREALLKIYLSLVYLRLRLTKHFTSLTKLIWSSYVLVRCSDNSSKTTKGVHLPWKNQ